MDRNGFPPGSRWARRHRKWRRRSLSLAGLLALLVAVPLIAGSLILILRPGRAPAAAPGAPAGPAAALTSRAPAGPGPGGSSPGPRSAAAGAVQPAFAADTAGRLLRSLPAGCVLEDVRVLWPGPWFSLRGHAVGGGAVTDRLKRWGAGWDGTRDPAGRSYENWFRRLEADPDAPGTVTFEFVLLPEGMGLPE